MPHSGLLAPIEHINQTYNKIYGKRAPPCCVRQLVLYKLTDSKFASPLFTARSFTRHQTAQYAERTYGHATLHPRKLAVYFEFPCQLLQQHTQIQILLQAAWMPGLFVQ